MGDGPAMRRLGDVVLICGADKIQRLCDRKEGSDLLHCHSISAPPRYPSRQPMMSKTEE